MSETIQYRIMEHGNCECIRQMDGSQYIGRAWRNINGELRLVDINYQDPDFPEGCENHLTRLRQTVMSGGIAIGAFDQDSKLIGFSALNAEPFGTECQYALLDQLFISLEHRRQGIGKQLLLRTAAAAKISGIDKLYICAGSSEETIAFYRAVGCVDAMEINHTLYEQDERDIQLEYSV